MADPQYRVIWLQGPLAVLMSTHSMSWSFCPRVVAGTLKLTVYFVGVVVLGGTVIPGLPLRLVPVMVSPTLPGMALCWRNHGSMHDMGLRDLLYVFVNQTSRVPVPAPSDAPRGKDEVHPKRTAPFEVELVVAVGGVRSTSV